MEKEKKINPDNIWEAVQTVTGETYIYHEGFKEEADVKNVYKFAIVQPSDHQVTYQITRFDFHPATPASYSAIRLNRSVIAFAWYIDPKADIISKIKTAAMEMEAKKAGLIIPGKKGF